MHGAIFASEFETFGLAAHELAATGIPIIISDIPAYSEFFNSNNSYVFSSGSPSSLASAALTFYSDYISKTLRRASISYPSPYKPYSYISSTSVIHEDLRLIEVAISRLEAECWDYCKMNK